MNEAYEIGTPVIIWGRPESGLILLFGEGRYEGNTFINGNYWPTVRLTNGREITVHQHGVAIGRAEAVAKTCKAFAGDVIEWDLDAYLRGEKPSSDQRRYQPNSVNGNTTALPPPKTASDRVLYLKKEIELQEAKKKVALKVIEEADKIIEAKKKEIAEQSNAVINEISAVNPDFMKQLVEQVAAKLKAEPEKPIVMADVVPVMQPVAASAPPIVARIVQQAPDPEVIDHTKLATED